VVTRHIETGNRPQIYDLIELWVEVGIGLGLVLALFDFLPRHTIRPSADNQTVLTVNDIAEWHTIFSRESNIPALLSIVKNPHSTQLPATGRLGVKVWFRQRTIQSRIWFRFRECAK